MVVENKAALGMKKLFKFQRRSSSKPSKDDRPEASSIAHSSSEVEATGTSTTGSSDIRNPGPGEDQKEGVSPIQESCPEESNDKETPNTNVNSSASQTPTSELSHFLVDSSKEARGLVSIPLELPLFLGHEVSTRLWDAAYEDLMAEYPALLESYKMALTRCLTQEDIGGSTSRRPSAYGPLQNETAQANSLARLDQMNRILNIWLNQIADVVLPIWAIQIPLTKLPT